MGLDGASGYLRGVADQQSLREREAARGADLPGGCWWAGAAGVTTRDAETAQCGGGAPDSGARGGVPQAVRDAYFARGRCRGHTPLSGWALAVGEQQVRQADT